MSAIVWSELTHAQRDEILVKHEGWLQCKEDGVRANLSGANLSGAYLKYANLNYANLTGANLSHANLSGANLGGVNLTYAYLTYANLTGANLTGANLTGANLTGASLTCANLRGANLSWSSHALLSHVLWVAADTEARQMLAAFVGRQTDWCWERWNKWQNKDRDWAVGVLATMVLPSERLDDLPEIIADAVRVMRKVDGKCSIKHTI